MFPKLYGACLVLMGQHLLQQAVRTFPHSSAVYLFAYQRCVCVQRHDDDPVPGAIVCMQRTQQMPVDITVGARAVCLAANAVSGPVPDGA